MGYGDPVHSTDGMKPAKDDPVLARKAALTVCSQAARLFPDATVEEARTVMEALGLVDVLLGREPEPPAPRYPAGIQHPKGDTCPTCGAPYEPGRKTCRRVRCQAEAGRRSA